MTYDTPEACLAALGQHVFVVLTDDVPHPQFVATCQECGTPNPYWPKS